MEPRRSAPAQTPIHPSSPDNLGLRLRSPRSSRFSLGPLAGIARDSVLLTIKPNGTILHVARSPACSTGISRRLPVPLAVSREINDDLFPKCKSNAWMWVRAVYLSADDETPRLSSCCPVAGGRSTDPRRWFPSPKRERVRRRPGRPKPTEKLTKPLSRSQTS